MSRKIPVHLFVISAGPAFAQLDSNSIIVTASRTAGVQQDQGVFSIMVASDLNSSLGDVLAVVQPAGIGLSNFSTVSTTTAYVNGQQIQKLQWTFQLIAPLATIKTTAGTLTTLQASAPKSNPNLTVSFSLQGTQVSAQALQSQTCDFLGLIGDAQAKAQALASAGGRTLAGLLAMSTSTGSPYVTATGVTSASLAQTCSISVKFGLLGN
jgi:hypothetical protein